eukprot:1150614-Pelagomonas_calceolata.AAC.2
MKLPWDQLIHWICWQACFAYMYMYGRARGDSVDQGGRRPGAVFVRPIPGTATHPDPRMGLLVGELPLARQCKVGGGTSKPEGAWLRTH